MQPRGAAAQSYAKKGLQNGAKEAACEHLHARVRTLFMGTTFMVWNSAMVKEISCKMDPLTLAVTRHYCRGPSVWMVSRAEVQVTSLPLWPLLSVKPISKAAHTRMTMDTI